MVIVDKRTRQEHVQEIAPTIRGIFYVLVSLSVIANTIQERRY
jgi:hypothetical protein